MAGSPKRVVGTLLFLIALVAVLAFYFVVFAGANQISGVPGADDLGIVAIGVSVLLGIVLLVLIILLAVRSRKPQEEDESPYFMPPEEEAPAFEEVGEDLVVYDVWTLPAAKRAWGGEEEPRTHAFYFPLNVESGVYVNDYVDIGAGSRLKLRTLLAGPADVGAASFVVPRREPEPEWAEREETAWPEAERPPRPARREPTRGEDFMSELERRFEGRQQTVETAAYYDYRGDDHPVEEVEGIGTVYAQKLIAEGVETTARLCYENAAKLAERIDVPLKTVERWQSMAQLMKVSGIGPQYAEALARAGIAGIDELKRRSAARIADQVNDYLDSLESNVLGTKITERRVAGWQAAAKAMRRVRQNAPAS